MTSVVVEQVSPDLDASLTLAVTGSGTIRLPWRIGAHVSGLSNLDISWTRQGGTLSMGEIMTRMSDAKQVALQKQERDLCDHLNALAACLSAAAGVLEELTSVCHKRANN